MKIKSDRALKRALELIELVCLEKPLKKKRKYEENRKEHLIKILENWS